jgi:hypothetical protein
LKRSGVLAGTASIGFSSVAPTPDALAGRAFSLTDVHLRPDKSSRVVRQFAPDAVVPITGTRGDWYVVEGGFVHREAIQPILPYNRPVLAEGIDGGFWAEVVAPVSAIREWCAGSAPILARSCYGGVVYVADWLVDDHGQVWYGITDAPGSPVVGWAAGLQFAPLTPAPSSQSTSPRIVIDKGTLSVFDGGHRLGQAAIAGPRLSRTETEIRVIQPGATLGSRFGVPWLMQLATGLRVYGAYWHNCFGAVGDGPDIELSTFAARWLYGLLTGGAGVM